MPQTTHAHCSHRLPEKEWCLSTISFFCLVAPHPLSNPPSHGAGFWTAREQVISVVQWVLVCCQEQRLKQVRVSGDNSSLVKRPSIQTLGAILLHRSQCVGFCHHPSHLMAEEWLLCFQVPSHLFSGWKKEEEEWGGRERGEGRGAAPLHFHRWPAPSHGHSDIKRGWRMEILAFTASVAEKVIEEEGWKWALYEPNCSFYHKHQLKRSLSNLSPIVRSD